jgi:hypothetical protein
MSRPPEPSSAERIAGSGLNLAWPRRGWVTDSIDMDHLHGVNPEVIRQVVALRLETEAQIHQVMATAAKQAAQLFK